MAKRKANRQNHVRLFILAVICLICSKPFSGAWAVDTCKRWVARAESVQGFVQVKKEDQMEWLPVKFKDTFCHGDMIKVHKQSRAEIVLSDNTVIRLDHETMIIISGLEKEKTFILDLIKGVTHFFSHLPISLKINTPFVNGSVKGTEFFINVESNQAFISVFKGQVALMNEMGTLSLASGQSGVAEKGQAPVRHVKVRPRDAIHWALYYPPVRDWRPIDFPDSAVNDWQKMVRKSIESYWRGDLSGAFSSLEEIPEDIQEPRLFTYQASLLVSVGRIEEADRLIEAALELDPHNSYAFALRSVIAVIQNRKEKSLDLATKAVDIDPNSAPAMIALSYSQQADFNLEGALSSIQDAVKLDPEDAIAWARLAELLLSVGRLDSAVEAAKKAVALKPDLSHIHTVLGFTYLTMIRTPDAKGAFQRAIELDQAAPLPRLGMGMAMIREGNLEDGRREIQIAAGLQPNDSLIRSYLGKAFFEEKNEKLAAEQFDIARELDPLDPTPWFYDAIQKQTINRPVEALHNLRKSMELNDNRAVYRSRLLLDEDLAARSASLARIYNDLGFQHLALAGGWRSLNFDPGNYSAHRLLADSYSALPRHEIARVSELLQSQLLQPVNITPVQPQLAESDLLILEGAGPADPSFNEFNPLFFRNRLALQASGIKGGNATEGDEVVISVLDGMLSFSLGQFYYKTGGFRENNDLDQDIYNALAQVTLSHKTSIQAEYRYKDVEKGDLMLRFDPDNFFPTLRKDELNKFMRLGFRHTFSLRSNLIASAIYNKADFLTSVSQVSKIEKVEDGYLTEVQHLFTPERFHIVSGVGYFDAQQKRAMIQGPPIIQFIRRIEGEEESIRHTNIYIYSQINYPEKITWTVGGSADFFKGNRERDQFNPKLGLTWDLLPNTTLRAAAFKVLKKMLISDQTLEPTQVAGFNQFFDDTAGTESWRYGVGLDQRFSQMVYGGVEFSKREIEELSGAASTLEFRTTDTEEEMTRAYFYWTPHNWLALSSEYQFEQFERDPHVTGEEDMLKVETHRFPLSIGLFHPLGLITRLKATYIDQKGEFGNLHAGFVPGETHFWIVDASIGYRLPKRKGLIRIEGKNLFDKSFNYQDRDYTHPGIYPERLILAKFTLAF